MRKRRLLLLSLLLVFFIFEVLDDSSPFIRQFSETRSSASIAQSPLDADSDDQSPEDDSLPGEVSSFQGALLCRHTLPPYDFTERGYRPWRPSPPEEVSLETEVKPPIA